MLAKLLIPLLFSSVAWANCGPYLSPAHEVKATTLSQLRALLDDEKNILPAHRTHAFLNQNGEVVTKSPISVVIYHGLYNSPWFMNWIGEEAHALGLNVLNVRLPQHFTARRADLDRMDYHDIFKLNARVLPIAEGLSQNGKVVYIGHSTGALAAVFAGLREDSTAGLVLFSPAFGVSRGPKLAMYAFSSLGLSGQLLDQIARYFPTTADAFNRYKSTFAGVQVDRMAHELSATELASPRLKELPILWIDSATDEVIDLALNEKLAPQFPRAERFVFPAELRIAHNSTFGSSFDARTFPELQAKAAMTERWLNFLKKFL